MKVADLFTETVPITAGEKAMIRKELLSPEESMGAIWLFRAEDGSWCADVDAVQVRSTTAAGCLRAIVRVLEEA